MLATDALIPINSFLPVPTRADGLGVELRYPPARSQAPVAFEVYSPDDSSGVYGPDGEEIIIEKAGQFINCYA